MNKCKICGKNAESDYCFLHKPRKKIKSRYTAGIDPYNKNSSNGIVWRGSKKQMEHLQMVEFFTKIWNNRVHKSEVSGKYLGKEPLSVFFHHILPKGKYKEASLDEKNIILLTIEEHENVETDMYRYEEVNKRREELIKKYL